jgi:hypothetical protein
LGVVYKTTAAHASNQNPFVENKHGKLQVAAIAMLYIAGAPRYFWEHAIGYANYVQNRSVHKALGYSSPIGIWEGKENNNHFEYTRVFGCKAFAYNTKADKLSKVNCREGVFLDIGEIAKSFQIYDLARKVIFSSVHVTFNEGEFPLRDKALWKNHFFTENGKTAEMPLFPSTTPIVNYISP